MPKVNCKGYNKRRKAKRRVRRRVTRMKNNERMAMAHKAYYNRRGLAFYSWILLDEDSKRVRKEPIGKGFVKKSAKKQLRHTEDVASRGSGCKKHYDMRWILW